MQTTSDKFIQRSKASMRPISWDVMASFTREFNPSLKFFTVGESSIGGPDIIRGTDDILQDWDRYEYTDYSDRIISIEWSRTEEQVNSVTSSLGTVVFDNHDSFFSADNFQFPFRPVKIYSGFGGENIPQFEGVSTTAPTLDDSAKTMTLNVIDFMSTLYNRPLESDVLLQNVRTDEALDAILQSAGLSPTQYVLDVGFNTIPIVYFAAQSNFGDAADALMQAEIGTIYMTESGVITFKNRQNYDNTIVASFDRTNTLDFSVKTQDNLINYVEIDYAPLLESDFQSLYSNTALALLIPANSTAQTWPTFTNPILTVDEPTLQTTALDNDSYFIANTASDGSGTPAEVSIESYYQFSTSYQINFNNPNNYPVYITELDLWGTDAEAEATQTLIEQNDASVDEYDQQPFTVTTAFIQNNIQAYSVAQIILSNYAEYGSTRQITVKGSPAYQIRDAVEVALDQIYYVATDEDTFLSVANTYGITVNQLKLLNPEITTLSNGIQLSLGVIPESYKIKTIQNTIQLGQFTQILTLDQFTSQTYFTIGVSSIGSNDVIAP